MSSDYGGVANVLTPAQLAAVAREAGFGANDPMPIAVALAESSGDANIMHPNPNGTTDLGCWQINTVHKGNAGVIAAAPGFFSLAQWRDPLVNARVARVIYLQAGSKWTDWVTFNEGDTNRQLDLARSAIGAGSLQGVSGITAGASNAAFTTPDYVIHGITISDPVWKPYFDASTGAMHGLGTFKDNGYGKQVTVPVQKTLPDGTMIVSLSADDISHYSSFTHVDPKTKTNLSAVTMQAQVLVGYVQDKHLSGQSDDGAGAIPVSPLDPLGLFAGSGRSFSSMLWIAGGAMLIVLGVVMMFKAELIPEPIKAAAKVLE